MRIGNAVNRPARRLAAVALLLASAGCTDSAVDAPQTSGSATVAVTLEFAASSFAGGPRSAYFRTDRIETRFSDGRATRDQRQVRFTPEATATHLPMSVRLRRPTETLQLDVAVRLGPDAVFRGSTPVTLRTGRTTTVSVDLEPVVAGVVGPESLPVLTAYGDTLTINGAAVFVTGDTIDASAASWTSLDPDVAAIEDVRRLVARSDGTARLVARFEYFEDTVTARVSAEVAAVTVSPDDESIPVGTTRQYSAQPVDRRGNPIFGRTISWSSSDPSVLAVDGSGLAHAVGVGHARVIATVEPATGDASANAVPGPPQTRDLAVTLDTPTTATFDAGVFPNGGSTDTWFEWGPVSTNAPSSLTLKRNIGAGLLRVPVSTTVHGLLPATSYSVRIVATNAAGRDESETVFFTTGRVGPTVETLPVTGLVPPSVTLNGTASANGSGTTVWFEWGADSTKATNATPPQTIDGFGVTEITAVVPSGPTGTTQYYRIVARNEAGTSRGAFLSWNTNPPQPPAVPSVTTLDATSTMTTAQLYGSVNPNGWPTDAWFEWSEDAGLSSASVTPLTSVGSGTDALPYSAALSGLMPNRTYYYRAAAASRWGSVGGAILDFTIPPDLHVPPPVAITEPATSVGDVKADLNGTANPNGSASRAWFEYGTDATLSVFTSTTKQAVGSGTADVSFSLTVTGLPVQPLFYRAVVSNAGGTTRGAIVEIRR